jgi:hypothetical protein
MYEYISNIPTNCCNSFNRTNNNYNSYKFT